jgi:hypothetical protein
MYTDISSFDKTVDTYVFRQWLEEVVLEMYSQYNDESLNNRVKVQLVKLFDYYYLTQDQLCNIVGPDPSGNLMTVFLNCARNYFYLTTAFAYLRGRAGVPESVKFIDNVTPKTNGDDILVSVSELVAPWFNIKTYADVLYHFYRVTVTDLDKVPVFSNPDATLFNTVEGANFLSRGFAKVKGGRYLAPLNLGSLWNAVYWSKSEPTAKLARVEHYRQIIDGCLRELALHNEAEFNLFVTVIKPRFTAIGGTWPADWSWAPFRKYMLMYSSCTDITKTPTEHGFIQAQGRGITNPDPPEVPVEPVYIQAPLLNFAPNAMPLNLAPVVPNYLLQGILSIMFLFFLAFCGYDLEKYFIALGCLLVQYDTRQFLIDAARVYADILATPGLRLCYSVGFWLWMICGVIIPGLYYRDISYIFVLVMFLLRDMIITNAIIATSRLPRRGRYSFNIVCFTLGFAISFVYQINKYYPDPSDLVAGVSSILSSVYDALGDF